MAEPSNSSDIPLAPMTTPTSRASGLQLSATAVQNTAVDGAADVNTPQVSLENVQEGAHWWYGSSDRDVLDMQRLGKHQEVRRRFGWWGTFGFASIHLATWEYVLVSLSTSLVNVGLAGLFWTFVATVICYTSVVVSLAEMASMAPTAGGQYSWTSEFAPPWCQKWLSYASGWISSLGWITSTASRSFVVATLVQAMLEVFHVDYVFKNWQATLIMLLFLSLNMEFNNRWARILPMLQTVAGFPHVGGWAAIFVALLFSRAGKYNTPHEVFLRVVSHSGWNNLGAACLISQASVIYCNLGSDSVVHIAEEVQDASLTVPRCIVYSYAANVFLGMSMLMVMLFCIGPLDTAIESEAPYVVLFTNMHLGGLAFTFVLMLFILVFLSNITAYASAVRQFWAVARDNGFPGSKMIKVINKDRSTPVHAVYAIFILAGALCLINMGSTLAFEVIHFFFILAILSTCMLSIGCLIHRRLSSTDLPSTRWSLGRLGLPINIFAFFYCGFIILLACFPAQLPVTLESANWAPLVWVAVILFTAVSYLAHGKANYTPPVDFIMGYGENGDNGAQTPMQGVDRLFTDQIR